MRVELRVETRQNLAAGADSYDRQQDGLGAYFIECLFADLEDLKTQAGIHALVYGLHRKIARRFPFAIYLITEGTVEVVAVLDCRQDPEAIALRLR